MTKHMGRISPSIKDQDKQSYQMFHSRLETDKKKIEAKMFNSFMQNTYILKIFPWTV